MLESKVSKDINKDISVELALSPEGHVFLDNNENAREQLSITEFNKINSFFKKGSAFGVLHLGIHEFSIALPRSFLFWQTFSRKLISKICNLIVSSDSKEIPNISAPEKEELQEMIYQAFFIKGFEYLSFEILLKIWESMLDALHLELNNFSGNVQDYIKHYNLKWNLIGRVCFHLAENKSNEDRPFAFLATYTTQLSDKEAKHLPLKQALQEYAGKKNKEALFSLLLPVHKAAKQSNFINNLLNAKTIFQALTWTVRDAYQFLKEIVLMESSGIVVKVPNWWNKKRPSRPRVSVKIGENQQSVLGLNSILNFDIKFALENGKQLTKEEWQSLINSKDNLVKIKGQWVEVDKEKLKSVLSHWDKVQNASSNGLSISESLRLLASGGSEILTSDEPEESETIANWSVVTAGKWLETVLDKLRNPKYSQDKSIEKIISKNLYAKLRPYQQDGLQWLWLLFQLKLGGCLADDMGLGKTIQVLSLILIVKYLSSENFKTPHLIIVPASLLGNWQAEVNRFAPSLKIIVAHSSSNNREKLSKITFKELSSADIIFTTYAFVRRLEWFKEIDWNMVILDEAQLIKNSEAKQTRAIKKLKSQVRFILTGTPIENRLSDLWSLFDFISPGFLGSNKVFSSYSKKASKNTNPAYYKHFVATLRKLIQPYILRRLKSDKKIIKDLPDKTEIQTYCTLSKEQVRLYQYSLEELSNKLEEASGIQRSGLVLSYLLRFKQICNHPVQWLGYGDYSLEASGKFIRLKEICEEIALKQEKVLVFTQFREIIPAIFSFLTKIFGREGVMLHGKTPIKKRASLVANFQSEFGPPFFVLSLKAGGTGLNLTRASHVIHFDRWWNPAVENQATDRAYRIGQKFPVLVHKFICQGTIEEKIDALITSKKNLSKEMLEESNEVQLTKLTNKELMKILSIDIKKALGEF